MKTFHCTVLLSSSGTRLRGLSLPGLEGKSETEALGRALCNGEGAPGSPVSKAFLSKTETSLQTSNCEFRCLSGLPVDPVPGSSTGDEQHSL